MIELSIKDYHVPVMQREAYKQCASIGHIYRVAPRYFAQTDNFQYICIHCGLKRIPFEQLTNHQAWMNPVEGSTVADYGVKLWNPVKRDEIDDDGDYEDDDDDDADLDEEWDDDDTPDGDEDEDLDVEIEEDDEWPDENNEDEDWEDEWDDESVDEDD